MAQAHVGDTLEAMALEKGSSRIYLHNKAKSQVDVIDREKRALIASWPITKGKVNVAMALDEANHRLFIACRNGEIVLMDTQTGKEIAALPITKGLDDLKYDAGGKRIYAACNGTRMSTSSQTWITTNSLEVPTGPVGRTALLVPDLKQYFVAMPQHGTTRAEVLVFEVH